MGTAFWKCLDESRGIYRYDRFYPTLQQLEAVRCPVLLLWPTLPEDDSLARMCWQDGFHAIYACLVGEDSDAAAVWLGESIRTLLYTQHPDHDRLILVGCGIGGLLGRRYVLLLGGLERVAFLFTLGSEHRFSSLASLYEKVYHPHDIGMTPVPEDVPVLDRLVMVNLYGEAKGTGFDGVIHGVHLPEAINVPLPLANDAICRDMLAYEAIRRHLQGKMWLVTVRLHALDMRGVQSDGTTGPFCFEINGWRAPFDGVFRVPVGKRFDFDPARAPLATIALPLTEAATDINFRLKDLGRTRDQPPRKLLTSLHTPLLPGRVSEHVLQDSLGSEVCVQVRCFRPEPVIESRYD